MMKENKQINIGQRQSSLTFERTSNYIKENIHLLESKPRNKHSNFQNEYNYMDGVLGCVKI